MTEATLMKSPLHQHHLDYGGQMVEFAGWELPIKYETSIKEEHVQCRTSGGLFDISHMGRLSLKGLHARRLLERVCSRRIGNMDKGQCRYSFICNERGHRKIDCPDYRHRGGRGGRGFRRDDRRDNYRRDDRRDD